jgi:DNA-nicking Smr family endonuclease
MNGRKDPEAADQRRTLREDEHELWVGITRSIKPLRRQPTKPKLSKTLPAAEPVQKPPTPPKIAIAKPNFPPARPAPPLAPVNRRTKQKLARGTEAIDARIDLHGMTQAEAQHALIRFLRAAQRDGAKFVLVITGKGRTRTGAEAESGVLRREVPRWLKLKEFRNYVVGIEPAHNRHGGEGALYVRLRRSRDGD